MPSTFDLVIKNGTVVTAEAAFRADVGVRGERIAAIGAGLSGAREIEAEGKLVTPGAVDIHVHMQMPIGDFRSSDDFFTGTRAAAFGGTTAIVDFVERKADETMAAAIAARRAEADPRVAIDYALHMTLGPDEMDILDQAPDAHAAGCTSFKLYMAYGFRLDDGQLLRALEAVRDVGGMPVVHAENWDAITMLAARNAASGRTAPRWHPRSRPAMLEGEAAGRLIDIAEFVGVPVHIFHVSCAAVVERVGAARARGLPVTAETCPQYLFLTQEAYDAPGVEGALPVCSPPLRLQSDQDALWRALSSGQLQVVTTDHCPFTRAEKETGLADFRRIPGGVPSVEMRFASLHSRGVRSGRLSLSQWVDACCTAPARIVGLRNKGRIAVGYDADLVVFDPDRTVLLSTDTLHENVDWTPYEGIEITGWPAVTISRGEVIVRDGEFLGAPGRGRFVRDGPRRSSATSEV